MQLTPSNAAPYLLIRRLLDPAAVVDGDVMAIDCSRRNRNVKVRRRDGSGLFLKQVQGHDAADLAALQREAACYQLPQRYPALAPLASIMPRGRHYDAAARILTLDLIAGGVSLYARQRQLGDFPASLGAAIGESLATLHGTDLREHLDDTTLRQLFAQAPPWILSAHQLAPAGSGATGMSGANRQLFDLVRRHPGFAEALEGLRSDWTHDRLVHGDMKWDNCVVVTASGDDAPRVIFTDWELADLGDPAWDVGALLQAWLAHWTSTIPDRPDARPQQLAGMAGLPLESMHPAIRAFWDRYATQRALAGGEREAFLERAVRSAAARMIQTAYESLAMSPQLSAQMILLLQLSLNVLTRPRDAVGHLFALT